MRVRKLMIRRVRKLMMARRLRNAKPILGRMSVRSPSL